MNYAHLHVGILMISTERVTESNKPFQAKVFFFSYLNIYKSSFKIP